MSKMPKELYVIEEREGDTTWYSALDGADQHAIADDVVTVALYKFAGFVKISAPIKVEPAKAR